jgi:hypothetical protein
MAELPDVILARRIAARAAKLTGEYQQKLEEKRVYVAPDTPYRCNSAAKGGESGLSALFIVRMLGWSGDGEAVPRGIPAGGGFVSSRIRIAPNLSVHPGIHADAHSAKRPVGN